MNTFILRLMASGLLLLAASSRAAIVIPGADGSDGALNLTTNTVIDLSLASTNSWDANNSARAGTGVYDANKWAVVFKYSSVTIASNATVTFKNHPSRAPVVWLVSGNVTFDGDLSLDGENYSPAAQPAEPGPGGFRGAAGNYGPGVQAGAAFGVGGGRRVAAGGTYQTQGNGGATSEPYGNPSLIPLIGGSGGGATLAHAGGGGGGGGAILIACAGTLTINGRLHADGGFGHDGFGWGGAVTGGRSGGGIRLVTDALRGSGVIQAIGKVENSRGEPGPAGGVGRIRIERVTNSNSITVVPDPSVAELAAGATAILWPPPGAPEVRILSIGGAELPEDPRAEFGTIGADAVISQVETTQVVIETRNVEPAAKVKVRLMPRTSGDYSEVDAAVDTQISENPLVLRWVATIPVSIGYSAAQVKVVRP